MSFNRMNYNGFNRFNPMQSNPMANLMQMLMSGGNPQQIMQSIIQKNPQAQVVLNQMRQSGMTPEQYVRQLAQQNNIDLNPMLNLLKQRNFR